MAEIPMKTPDSMFTDQQWEAIHSTDSNLLISASAGSGKTMVLVNRIIEQIKKGIAVDELLVVTFTNAAAKEMKQRIQKALQEEINADPEAETRHHLVQQLPKLGHANISTLHSFCLKVIERYYYLIDFDPVFRQLTDDTEIELIKEDVWDELLEELYEEADEGFQQFMEAYAGDRNDDNVTQMVFQLHEFSRANENPNAWLASLTDLYEVPNGNLEEAKIYQDYVKKQFIDELTHLVQLVKQALNLANYDEHLEKQIAILENEKEQYETALNLLEANKLEACYEFVNAGYKFQTFRGPTKSKTPDDVLAIFNDEMKNLRNEAKKGYQKFEENFALSPAEQVEIIEQTKEQVQVLGEITQQFSNRYQAYKAERKLIDFNDLEHLTLEILKGESANEVSEASVYYREKFMEVLVDEYQDINALQEAILLRLAREDRENGNYFMVGDVKQSIYGFRLADPNLFLSKYDSYANSDEGERIILAENFRSRQDVLSFTNFIFTQLMDRQVGNLDYDENAELVYGNKDFDESEDFATEFLVYEQENTEATEEEAQITDKKTGEILMVAARIKELVASGYEIYDKTEEKMRPIEYRDIVLLTPTKSNNLEIQEIFQEANIPPAINETQNFFQTTEVTIMMSLLKVIDNPRQEIPLVATLRSPIVGLNEVELTYIRLQNKQADFYEAMSDYAKAAFKDPKNIAVQKKVQAFMKQLDTWREYARRHSVVELLRLLYQETGYMHYVGGMSGGKQRRANLEALYQRAASYEETSFKGLYRFIRFIDKMQERDKDLAEPTSILSEQNAVRVMTIHASKGLEFPVVFLMDMSKRFNQSDWTGEYVFDRDLGIGLQYKNPETRIKSSTLVDTAIKDVKKQNAYAEEMRVLYVALTRAEQKLFLVGTKKTKEKAFDDWDKGNGGQEILLPAQLRLSTNNYMDWLGMATARHQIAAGEVNSVQENKQIKQYPVHFVYNFYSEAMIIEVLRGTTDEMTANWLEDLVDKQLATTADQKTNQAVNYTLDLANFEYPYQMSTQTTNFQSVSEVKQLFEEPNNEKMAKIDWTDDSRINRYTEDLFERPKFLQEETSATPAEIGQATHFLLQHLNLSDQPTTTSVSKEITKMTEEKLLNKQVAEQINVDKIVQYFQTSFGKEIVKNSEKLEKEVLFSLMMNARDVFTDMEVSDDSILIHGIIDGYFERDDGLVLFDYKTDQVAHFGELAEEELKRRYKGQVMLYKTALETIMNQSVVEVNIISLDLEKTIPVEP
jgi:ATP-dependent helicase/nuclease subunit A